jgi:hypothetical protein
VHIAKLHAAWRPNPLKFYYILLKGASVMLVFLLGVIVVLTPSILTLTWLLWRVEGAQGLRFDPERKHLRALDDRKQMQRVPD